MGDSKTDLKGGRVDWIHLASYTVQWGKFFIC